MISKTAEYALRAVVVLARQGDAPLLTAKLAEETQVPAPYLAKVLLMLQRRGLVRSKRGVAGGFALARNPDKLTLLDVMQVVDEPLTLNLCLLEGHQCERECTCPVHCLWTEAREKIEEVFSSKSLTELVAEREQLEPLEGNTAAD